MLTLYHHPFDAASRFVRLMLGEYGLQVTLVMERAWQRRPEFLALNPAATVPVMVEDDGQPVCGPSVVMEYLDETRGYRADGRRLMPDDAEKRAEMRRLVAWFGDKIDREAIGLFAHEKIYKLELPREKGGGAPDTQILRAARTNMVHHLRYIGYLAGSRNWLAGDTLSYADLAAAAQLSVADYLGEVPWKEDEQAKTWYARIKSRPSFRPLLLETVRGVPAAQHYGDLDF